MKADFFVCSRIATIALCVGLLMLAVGCTTSTRDLPSAKHIGNDEGYRDRHIGRTPGAEPALLNTYVILAFSGGGTRAAALAQGVLREMEATPSRDAPSLSLLHAIDMLSSTSGGSVTAANFALRGPEGYGALHQRNGFLYHDGIADLAAQILNPANNLRFAVTPASRIEVLPEMLRRQVLGDATFRTLRERANLRGPLLLLNSADMRTGVRFTFTQEQLDRLCIDLRDIRLADAVAASAAFPVAFTPLPLPVHSPCPAQAQEFSKEPAGIMKGLRNQARLPEAWSSKDGNCDATSPIDRNVFFGESASGQASLPRALRQWQYLNLDVCDRELPPDRRLRFVHLLDGGTADNLALSAPLEAATGGDAGGRLRRGLRDGKIKEIVVISVNARSQGAAPGPDTSTPGIFSMLLGTINTSIDSGSGGLSAQMDALEAVLRQHYPNRPTVVRRISLDFERIADAACRAAFQGIATSWTLKPVEVDALQEMASAMLRNDQQYLALSGGPRNPAMGQARAKAACGRLLKQEGPPLVFGG